jgi:hypothetical protein
MIQIVLISALSLLSAFLFIKLKKEKEKVQWFEDWGRKYLDKYRDEARRNGLTE